MSVAYTRTRPPGMLYRTRLRRAGWSLSRAASARRSRRANCASMALRQARSTRQCSGTTLILKRVRKRCRAQSASPRISPPRSASWPPRRPALSTAPRWSWTAADWTFCRMHERFLFATGIENSYPTIEWKGRTIRVDEMEKTCHYKHWKQDFQLVRELGIEYLRYGPPYYRVHLGDDRYDWSFADETFGELHRLRIKPIADLCHFGVPDWIGGLQNRDWPRLFATYARTFAERFPWVRYYTPVNEIYIAALFSAQYGWWNEREHSDRAFVNALQNLCRANLLAMQSILDVQPNAIFIQSESSEYFHPAKPKASGSADFYNEKRFLSLDLTYGHPVDYKMYEYLLDNGMTRDEYHWFARNHRKQHCIMGNDYYKSNEHLVDENGGITPSGEIFGYYVITHQYFARCTPKPT